MPTIELAVDQGTFDKLVAHLCTESDSTEQAAFLFCRYSDEIGRAILAPIEVALLKADAFECQSRVYLELRDETRAFLIKKAHDLDACLVEAHSHPEQHRAEFSPSDLFGFEEFVPHVRWRLKGRPYLAIVFGARDFDGLSWYGNSNDPKTLDAVVVDGERLIPTNRTIQQLTEAPK
jgi:hypothetical protein